MSSCVIPGPCHPFLPGPCHPFLPLAIPCLPCHAWCAMHSIQSTCHLRLPTNNHMPSCFLPLLQSTRPLFRRRIPPAATSCVFRRQRRRGGTGEGGALLYPVSCLLFMWISAALPLPAPVWRDTGERRGAAVAQQSNGLLFPPRSLGQQTKTSTRFFLPVKKRVVFRGTPSGIAAPNASCFNLTAPHSLERSVYLFWEQAPC